MSALPVFDLRTIERADEARRLRGACASAGFFYVVGHGVDPALERRLAQASASFFSLPLEQKNRIAMSRGGVAWRGYFPLRGELTSGEPDLKEGLYFGEELGPDDPRVAAGWPMHGANLFPDEPVELRELVLAYIDEQERVAQRVLRALAVSLGLDPSYFPDRLTHRPTKLFRVFHYPPPSSSDRERWGVGEHTDYGLITLLRQDDCGGLEVKSPAGWIDAPPIEGSYVCNLGDMLDRLTGGFYRSTPHRVRNTSGRSRYSFPFFLDPAFDAPIEPLPCALARPIELDAAERWDRASVHTLEGTYGDYLRSKVSKVFPSLEASVLREGKRAVPGARG